MAAHPHARCGTRRATQAAKPGCRALREGKPVARETALDVWRPCRFKDMKRRKRPVCKRKASPRRMRPFGFEGFGKESGPARLMVRRCGVMRAEGSVGPKARGHTRGGKCGAKARGHAHNEKRGAETRGEGAAPWAQREAQDRNAPFAVLGMRAPADAGAQSEAGATKRARRSDAAVLRPRPAALRPGPAALRLSPSARAPPRCRCRLWWCGQRRCSSGQARR